MQIQGHREFSHPLEVIYDAAIDLEGIASEFSQVSFIDRITTETIRVTIHLNFGVYSGDYFADLTLNQDRVAHSFDIKGHHKSKIGGMTLNCHGYVKPAGVEKNLLHISGDFNMSGMLRFANKTVVRKGVEFGIALMLDTIGRRAKLYYQDS